MKKLFLATTAVLALSAGSASAADLGRPVYKAAPPPPPACAQFGGVLCRRPTSAGGYYDHKWNDRDAWISRNCPTTFSAATCSTQKTGFIGGVQGGYNWQTGCTVFGVRRIRSWAKHQGPTLSRPTAIPASIRTRFSVQPAEERRDGRARTGVVVDNLLLYVTGGLAYGRFNRTATVTDLNGPASESFSAPSKTKWGWTIGVGTEWAIGGNWSLQSEFLYMRFEKDETSFTCARLLRAPACQALRPSRLRMDQQDRPELSLRRRAGHGEVLSLSADVTNQQEAPAAMPGLFRIVGGCVDATPHASASRLINVHRMYIKYINT